MDQKSLHLNQAIWNEELARDILKNGKHFDWTITICLYSALHYLGYKEKLTEQHHKNKTLIYDKFGTDAYSAYQALYTRSRNARYFPHIAAKFIADRKEARMALNKLEEFKKILNIK